MSVLFGTYECKLDAKGRFMLPSGLRSQIADGLPEGLVIKRSVFQKCLEIYPMNEWLKMMEKVNSLNPFVKKNNDFKRLFTAGVKTVELDSAGRFLIPKDLVAYSGLSKELVLSCSTNIIEVWDKDKYEEVVGDASSDFADLAEQVMGDLYGE